MRHKILIVDQNEKDRKQLESILQEIVEEGGELIFTDMREEGLAILHGDHPQLVLVDTHLLGEEEDWIVEKSHVVVIRHKDEPSQKSEDFIEKPFKAQQVLQKCHRVLGTEKAPQIPPM